jgi:hypothetical protein
MNFLRDLILEIRIQWAFWLALQADPRTRKAERRFEKYNELVSRRRPEQVRKLKGRSFG